MSETEKTEGRVTCHKKERLGAVWLVEVSESGMAPERPAMFEKKTHGTQLVSLEASSQAAG